MRKSIPKPRQIKPPRVGKIIIPADTHPWPHELRVARILAKAGHAIEFLPKGNIKTPDILMDGVEYEIKSPFTNNSKKIIRNIKRALQQSRNVIIDSSRIEGLRDDALLRLLTNRAQDQKSLKRLILITKHGQVVDIKSLIR